MSIKINKEVCTGCPNAKEPPCVRICPGDLLTKNDGKAEIRESKDCWDCGACLKSCPNQAIVMYLPVQIEGFMNKKDYINVVNNMRLANNLP